MWVATVMPFRESCVIELSDVSVELGMIDRDVLA